MAADLDLKLDAEDLSRLRPMVADLLAVGRRLRRVDRNERQSAPPE